MTGFVLLAALLAVLALGFVLLPLLRRRAHSMASDRAEANAAIYRDQLAELGAERAQGLISAARFEETRAEIERRLAEDLAAGESAGAASKLQWQGSRLALVLGLVLPIVAAGLYLLVGTPSALDPTAGVQREQAQHEVTPEQINAMVAKLAARLEKEPGNAEGWHMLGRSYAALGRFDEAAKAYAKLLEVGGRNPDALADYADALAMASGRNLQGEPYRAILEALALDPQHVKALALAGSAEFARGDYAEAIAHWERMLERVPPESDLAQGIRSGLQTARARLGQAGAPAGRPAQTPAPVASGAEAVQGIVMLDAALAQNARPDDVVFVLARPAEGPRMPLAVARIAVRDLPYAFRLDDSMAMAPNAKLSQHARVVVTARVSKRGTATPAKGDLEGASAPVAPGTSGLQITISKVVE